MFPFILVSTEQIYNKQIIDVEIQKKIKTYIRALFCMVNQGFCILMGQIYLQSKQQQSIVSQNQSTYMVETFKLMSIFIFIQGVRKKRRFKDFQQRLGDISKTVFYSKISYISKKTSNKKSFLGSSTFSDQQFIAKIEEPVT